MTAALLGLIAAINPAAAVAALATDRRTNRPGAVAAGGAIAAVVLLALAAAGDSILDVLDVNLGTYQLGAGAAVGFAGIRWLVFGPATTAEEPESDRGLTGYVAFPALITPAAAALAISVGAEDGVGEAIAGIVIGVVAGTVGLYYRRSISRNVVTALVRLLGAIAVVIGIALAVNGVRTL